MSLKEGANQMQDDARKEIQVYKLRNKRGDVNVQVLILKWKEACGQSTVWRGDDIYHTSAPSEGVIGWTEWDVASTVIDQLI